MKIIYLIFAIIMLLTQYALSNNVQVSNVRLINQNTTDDFTMVEFDISWENSWRYSNGPANWDAVWVFVKYRVGAAGEWKHAWLNNSGHTMCSNTTFTNGLLTPSSPFHSTSNPVMGLFLYRNVPGTGNFLCQDVQLRWNYGSNTISDNAIIDIRVFAIEMVYIPQGPFYVGSGGNEVSAFYTYPNPTTPYLINSEASINVGTSGGNLYYNFVQDGHAGDQSGPIHAQFPKGFNAFYAMKYEISQQAYVDFLNTLSRTQQNSRVNSDISDIYPPNAFVMADYFDPSNRNGIRSLTPHPPSPAPVEFFCDLNTNNFMNDFNDGQCVAANFLVYHHVAAYMDWASLRLMTELEFEKCGRGFDAPTANEFAWGNGIIYLVASLFNSGQSTEIPSNTNSNAGGTTGPLRNGIFARSTSNRTNSGAGYHGCLEISGNLTEFCISVGSANGRNYQGIHGNGLLTNLGNADCASWPAGSPADGLSGRGGYWTSIIPTKRLSDRTLGLYDLAFYDPPNFGGRGVRSLQ